MAHLGLVLGKTRHPKDAEIASAIQAARSRPPGQPRLLMGVLNESGELYRYVALDGHGQGRHFKARLRELGLASDYDPGVLRFLGSL